MLDIGFPEFLLISFVLLIVVGPKDFPIMLKKIGSWIGSAKRYVANVQNEVSTLSENEIINDENKSDNNKDKDLNDTK